MFIRPFMAYDNHLNKHKWFLLHCKSSGHADYNSASFRTTASNTYNLYKYVVHFTVEPPLFLEDILLLVARVPGN